METVARVLKHPVPGENAPDVEIVRADTSRSIALSELWKTGPALLIFLRHFGCSFCREQVAQLSSEQHRFQKLGVTIGLITITKAEDTDRFCRDRELAPTFVCLSDFSRAAYQAYGLVRGGPHELMTPHVFARGFQAALHGHFLGLPKGDPFQMPGVFIVDSSGAVRYAHRHEDAADNPSNSKLLSVIEELSLSPRS